MTRISTECKFMNGIDLITFFDVYKCVCNKCIYKYIMYYNIYIYIYICFFRFLFCRVTYIFCFASFYFISSLFVWFDLSFHFSFSFHFISFHFISFQFNHFDSIHCVIFHASRAERKKCWYFCEKSRSHGSRRYLGIAQT